MNLKLNQQFVIEKLVGQKGKFTQERFQQILVELINKYKEVAVDNGERIVTTTKSIEVIGGEQILDAEVLLPLKEEIFVEEPYEYKKCIKITNALYARLEDYMLLTT